MTYKLTAVFLMGVAHPVWANRASRQIVQATKTERVKLAQGGTLTLTGSFGYLNIEGWDQPEVEITVIKSTSRGYDPNKREEAARRLDRVKVVTERRSDSEVDVSTRTASRRGRWGVTTECRIRAPRDARLMIHQDGGYVLITDMTGDVEAHAKSGDIMLMVPKSGAYSIDAQCEFGGVYSDFEGVSRRQHLVGDRFVRDSPPPSHQLLLRMGVGGITINEVPAKP